MGICIGKASSVNPHVRHHGPPNWTRSLEYRNSVNVGLTDTSDGMHQVTPNHVVRERLGRFKSDAARWGTPFTEGKHVFEVFWPAHKNRGTHSCIGVGSGDVALCHHGKVSLVGKHSQSWGLDLSRRRAIHFDKIEGRVRLGIPEKFFMYLDMDSGKIGFGADVDTFGKSAEFYGWLLNNMPKRPDKPLYVMVSSCRPSEQIHLFYRGSAVPEGGFDLCETAGDERYRQPAGRQAGASQSIYPQLGQPLGAYPPPYFGPSAPPVPYQQNFVNGMADGIPSKQAVYSL